MKYCVRTHAMVEIIEGLLANSQGHSLMLNKN
jgi:hypothetical protein